MNNGRNELNNLLLDKQYDKNSTSLKRVVVVGLFLFAVSIGIFALIKFLNEDNNSSSNLIEPSTLEQQSIKQSNPSLFKNINNLDTTNDNPDQEIKSITSDLIKQLTDKNKKEKTLFDEKEKINQNTKINQPQDIRDIGKEQPFIKPKKSQYVLPNEIKRGFYVQVGAFYTRNPDKPFLESIARKNYSYTLYRLKLNNRNLTKVLIGPYETKQDALEKLPDIKQIEKDSYILKIN